MHIENSKEIILHKIESNDENGIFRTGTYWKFSILESRTLSFVQQSTFIDFWKRLSPGEIMRCHTPIFGATFIFSSEEIHCSICFECNNIFWSIEDSNNLHEFDGNNSNSQAFLIFLKSLFLQ